MIEPTRHRRSLWPADEILSKAVFVVWGRTLGDTAATIAVHALLRVIAEDMDQHAWSILSNEQAAQLRSYRRTEPNMRVSHFFGPEVLGPYLRIFLARVEAGSVTLDEDARRLAPDVVMQIGRILFNSIARDHVRHLFDFAALDAQARRALPKARQLLEALATAARPHPEQRGRISQFSIGHLDDHGIWLEPMVSEEPIGPFPLPPDVLALCVTDWTMTAEICHCELGHHFIEVTAVTPFGLQEPAPSPRILLRLDEDNGPEGPNRD